MVDDVQAIKNIIYSYAELLDLGDIEGLRRLFGKITVRIHGRSDEMKGTEAIRGLVERPVHLYDGIPSTKHVVTNVIVELDDNRHWAVARSYFTAFQARPELPLQPIIAGRWHDRFERDGDRWQIVERIIYSDLQGNLTFHIAP